MAAALFGGSSMVRFLLLFCALVSMGVTAVAVSEPEQRATTALLVLELLVRWAVSIR